MYSKSLIERYKSILGDEGTKKLISAHKKKQIKAIRVNTLRITPDKLLNRLKNKGFRFKRTLFSDYGFYVTEEPTSIAATTEHLLGYYYIQDPASMIPPVELNPKSSDLVLDMTAAPGGKTTHLAQLMRNRGTIIAVDVNKEKVKALRSNIQRLGIRNTIIYRMKAEEIRELNVKFDKILLDAPCTAEGTIRKNPERKKITEDEIRHYSKLQKELIKTAYFSLRRNGILLYSVCSTLPEECELNIRWAVDTFGFEILPLQTKNISKGLNKVYGKSLLKDLKNCGRVYPYIHNTQGFFIAKLKKK